MSSEIEQFLKRIAERQREQTARESQQQQPQPSGGDDGYQPSQPIQRGTIPRQRSRRDLQRQQNAANDALVVAELVGPGTPARPAQSLQRPPRPSGERKPKQNAPIRDPHIAASYRVGDAVADRTTGAARGPASRTDSSSAASSDSANIDSAVEGLLELLGRPQGMQQAVLLKEILDRPLHRW